MSDSDSSLDSELLAVAGARGKGTGGKKRGRQAASDDYEDEEVSSEEVSLDDESDLDEARSKKRGQKEPARKRQARGRGRAGSEDEDDESDDGERLELDDEDLIEDEEDRKRLAAMTELQREFELATRAERRNQELLRQKLLKKGGAAETTAEKAEKAGAKAAKRVGRAKSGREEREEAAKKSAMEELKAARERKARGAEERARKRDESEEPEGEEDEEAAEERRERREREQERRRDRRDESEDEEGALDSEDMSEDERGARDMYGRRRPGEAGEDEEDEAPDNDVKKIQVRREKLELWVNEPFFEETLPGCMVRVAVGEYPDPVTNFPVRKYMLCQVVTVETRAPGYYKDSGKPWKSPYEFGPKGDKTHKWLLVERGASQRGMPLALVSNSGFSDAEFESWQRSLKEQGRPQISRRQANEVYERLVKANTYTYTSEDVDRLLKEKKAKGAAPRNVALEKAQLENMLQHAKDCGDADTVAQLEEQIAALAAQLQSKGSRRGDGMANLNKRNAELNFKNALDNVSNRVGGAAGAQDITASQLDPFSRRTTRPMIYWRTKRPGEDPEQEGAAPAPAEEQAGAAEEDEEAQQAQQRRGKLDLDSIVDLSALDLSVLERPNRMPPLARKLLGPTWRPDPPQPGARLISFEEYRQSKGW